MGDTHETSTYRVTIWCIIIQFWYNLKADCVAFFQKLWSLNVLQMQKKTMQKPAGSLKADRLQELICYCKYLHILLAESAQKTHDNFTFYRTLFQDSQLGQTKIYSHLVNLVLSSSNSIFIVNLLNNPILLLLLKYCSLKSVSKWGNLSTPKITMWLGKRARMSETRRYG